MIKLLIGAVVAAVIVVVSFTVITPKLQSAATSSGDTNKTEDTTSSFSVAIDGEVSKAGTYVLSEGATMQNLIDAAGGTTKNADPRTYYSDAVLTSGMTYYIGPLYDATDICSSKEISKVNINNDSASALSAINGFTTSVSESVVSYRTSNGEFKTIEAIMDVYGIGNATYRKVRNYIYLHE